MNFRRKINRISFYLKLRTIRLVGYLDHRLFMTLYIPLLKSQGIKMNGNPRYIGSHVKFDDYNLISLGDRVVISDECHLLTHDYSITTALLAGGEKIEKDIALIRGISIGNNVFIGKKSIIMPNTRIGDNVIIGAGSVVRGKIESNSIYAGNPSIKINTIDSQMDKWKALLKTDQVRIDQ